ncbi:MAG TPA: efflux RND transporter permease subunit [Planctomycetaceae bacterium]|nr:efflux RND transporter permease subunit [Planctomycetaceae bacterium]
MISRFFINRPIFAAVLSIVITLAGGVSVFNLGLAQFPPVTPPTVQVTCTYPGASAKDVAEAIAAPIEQQVNGVEGMMYMYSQCANDGSYNLTVTFRPGFNLNMAQVLVQNRVSLAVPLLPDVIKQTGVTTIKRSPDILCGIAILSPDNRYDQLFISNYAVLQVKDELSRVEGVGDIFLFGQRDYSMRIWVDPHKMASRGLAASDVSNALREQNAPVATGAIGQQPAVEGQETQITLSTLGRLTDAEQFGNIIVKRSPDGRLTRLKDVARVELGAKNEDVSTRLDGKQTIFLAIFQMPDANALDTHDRVIAKMEELKKSFPEGLTYEIGFDTTPYTRESIREVVKTLRDAIILVAAVVLLFLQNWRSSLIPLVAVPVAIVGTFAAMLLFGFSLNNLTLFGLVLAIGIVVDDAIVVVEAVEHHIENGLSPRDATIRAMDQVSGPVIAVGLVLSAVFIPCAFVSGITGAFFRQFAVTISVSTVISAFNSLTLSPALTAVLLRSHDKETAPPLPRLAYVLGAGLWGWFYLAPWAMPRVEPWLIEWAGSWLPASLGPTVIRALPGAVKVAAAIACGVPGWFAGLLLNRGLKGFFVLFNRGFARTTRLYTGLVGGLVRVSAIVLLVYVGLLGVTYWSIGATPKGFIPLQDMGYLICSVQLPDASSKERTEEVMARLVAIARKVPGVMHVTGVTGQSFVLNAFGSNFGSMFVNLDDYADRRDAERSSDSIAAQIRQAASEIEEAQIFVFGPPPVRGAGRAGGFTMMVEDRGDLGPKALQEETENLVNAGRATQKLVGLASVFRANVPQLFVEPDPRECMSKGVSLQSFADTLSIFVGSLYVNDFNLFGRTWQVNVQADQEFRDQVEDLIPMAVRSNQGMMVPVGSLASIQEINGPLLLTRYNMYPAASINGVAGPGMSSGQAIDLLASTASRELSKNMAFEWSDMSYLEVIAGDTAMLIFGFAVVMVFLVLAAQYESWSLPLAVILVVPMCLLSAIIGVNIAAMDVNIFTRIGFVVLVGLASKNAILIVEFAKVQRRSGADRRSATLEACKLRLRPIVMTSLAFILGVLPLIVSRGAGAEMRQTLGTAVFSGMLGVTLFGLLLTPVFFYSIDWLGDAHLFRSLVMQRFNTLSLSLVSLKPVRSTVAQGWSRLVAARQQRVRIARTSANGNGTNGHLTGGNGAPASESTILGGSSGRANLEPAAEGDQEPDAEQLVG